MIRASAFQVTPRNCFKFCFNNSLYYHKIKIFFKNQLMGPIILMIDQTHQSFFSPKTIIDNTG